MNSKLRVGTMFNNASYPVFGDEAVACHGILNGIECNSVDKFIEIYGIFFFIDD